ncbi:MAG: transposase [Nocardiopsaceae bacterium]|nr:transposase [Nocardiopsaceae bacterium]
MGDNVIVIADRGLESYNNFAHIEKKGWNYLIRVKDLGSSGSG